MDYNAFASLAHFRILLLPVGSISRATFDQWAAEIRTLESLRLSDIPPGTKDEKGEHTFTPVHHPLSCRPSSIYAQPQVQGIFTPMFPDPSPIYVTLQYVPLPTISFPSGGNRHCKLFTDRLPLLYNRRIQRCGQRPVSP